VSTLSLLSYKGGGSALGSAVKTFTSFILSLFLCVEPNIETGKLIATNTEKDMNMTNHKDVESFLNEFELALKDGLHTCLEELVIKHRKHFFALAHVCTSVIATLQMKRHDDDISFDQIATWGFDLAYCAQQQYYYEENAKYSKKTNTANTTVVRTASWVHAQFPGSTTIAADVTFRLCNVIVTYITHLYHSQGEDFVGWS
jgi:hypothetical protein